LIFRRLYFDKAEKTCVFKILAVQRIASLSQLLEVRHGEDRGDLLN
jgi:hypothetical protein